MSSLVESHKTRPPWLRVKAGTNADFHSLVAEFKRNQLATVCQESICPNIWECFSNREATFLILGTTCTRSCAYCRLEPGSPTEVDTGEPDRLGAAVASLNLKSVVITSVTRDDLPDGGASAFVASVKSIRSMAPSCDIELLIPDFAGNIDSLEKVVKSRPDVIGHNLETVARLFPSARPQAGYAQSLRVLKGLTESGLKVKSGILVGLGEKRVEIRETLRDISNQGVEWITIGQYLQPSGKHLPVSRYYSPQEFLGLAKFARGLRFKRIISGPLVRSSYRGARS